ncbi:MAG: Stp1/IreP family PP2C-type Ser/Thr phosphatase [Solirubrobacteraceae bacterium]
MLRAVDSICRSDTGLQRRENEDSAYASAPLFVVADGMGGAQAGEVASRMAIETFQHGLSADGSPEERLAERVRTANKQIYERSRAETGREGMGTTLTAAYLDDAQLAIAHVGDSRAYMFRDGQLSRLTQDHSLVDELVRRGKLTEEQAAEHPQRSIITRALGPEPDVEVDTFTYPVQAGDVLLLCSDGLTSMISEDRVTEVLAGASDLEEAARTLIGQANEAGGRDNITVVLFRVEDVEGEGGPDFPVEETIVGHPAPEAPEPAPRPAVAVAPASAVRSQPRPSEPDVPPPAPRRRRSRKPIAALVAVLAVLLLVGGGGYLATRQLYFIGTNGQGIVTIYRGLPYDLPAGIPLYETFFVSGVPASLVPGDRRKQFFGNQLRSQSDAMKLVRELELGRVSR